ncbi:MAG: N-acetyl-alpha-D-glucosaminyl L-malate synthase BshA [Alicyclobacillus macrosporangiidus]|uniref:N-acetyl-alpha-D-glucosaminyl L-malate synthase BshA n=1 Tax=Alicyclobacillus macrosporangiidus TaxID=392015 RepID=UPI0026F0783E|nr:N-acetyl-alpha-D-glucosaminyl L-malate synthase BshA [Alicyclobacillus macrosporangiidus]MCL6598659.1 N-acetyl-alpha-D-glucosaminyl L-malate synthase BshA [Alicyclobacillus macrosporangiidus]
MNTFGSSLSRVAVIGNYLPRQCGIATFTTDLCESIVAQYPDLTCLALPVNDRPDGYAYPERVRFELAQHDLTSYQRAADFLNMNNIEVVCLQHEYGIFGGPAGSHILALLRELRMPVVTTLHGTDVTLLSQDRTLFDLVRFGLLHSDAVTAVSRSLAAQTEARFGLERPIHCIHNFVDPHVFRPAERPDLRRALAPNGEPILLHVSNFRPVKRVADVLRVFARVRTKVAARLVLVGEGPDAWEARQLTETLGIAPHVVFLGKQDDVVPLYQVADLFLLPSQQESFGLAALEAMACGVPVIASDAGGIPEVVLDGETGFLRPVGDVEGMAEAAVRVLSDDALHQRLSRQAVARARSAFSMADKVKEYERLYQSLCEGEPV